MMMILVTNIFAYLLGSISSAIIVSKLFKVTDPRKIGSGNPGTTNILRYAGKTAAALTLIGDVTKGIIPIALGYKLDFTTGTLSVIGLCSLLGHIYPIFYHYKGGKGIATFIGILAALNWLLACCFVLTWSTTAFFTRYSSLSALVAITVTPIFAFMIEVPTSMLIVLICCSLIIFIHHKKNLVNLMKGDEKKIGQKADL
jgi:glycerol-3-phosphate acyltransferase PlsY